MNTKICSFWIINRSQSLYFKNSFFNTTNCKEARKCHLTNLIPYVSSVSTECSNGKNVSFSINNRPNNLRFFFNLHTPFTDTYILTFMLVALTMSWLTSFITCFCFTKKSNSFVKCIFSLLYAKTSIFLM